VDEKLLLVLLLVVLAFLAFVRTRSDMGRGRRH
jgi:hypothetical protein